MMDASDRGGAGSQCPGRIDLPVAHALRGLLDGLSEGLLLLTAEGRIFAVNPGALRILKRDRDALIGAPFAALVREGSYRVGEAIRHALDNLSIKDRFTLVQDQFPDPPLHTLNIRLSAVRLGPEQGAMVVILAAFSDVLPDWQGHAREV